MSSNLKPKTPTEVLKAFENFIKSLELSTIFSKSLVEKIKNALEEGKKQKQI